MPRLLIGAAGRRNLRVAAAVAGVWTLVAVIAAGATVAAFRQRGEEIAWWPTFGHQLGFWALWAAFSPVVYLHVRRDPIRARRWLVPVVRHLLVGLAWMAVYGVATVFIVAAQYDIPRPAILPNLGSILDFRFALDGLFYCGIVAVSHYLVLRRDLRRREQEAAELRLSAETLRRQLSDARLEALRAQLHPHFLFNSLNTVSGLVRCGDPTAAVEVVARLGDILRYALETREQPFVPLASELAFARSTLAVHRARYPERLGFRIDAGADALETPIPALLLQPLLENAIVHGVAALDGGTIALEARRDEDGHLTIELRNPIGRTRDHEGHGIGLAATRERLALLYGRPIPVELHRSNGTATVRLRLPADSAAARSAAGLAAATND